MIRIIIGNIGTGKTMLLASIALVRWGAGYNVLANMSLDFPHTDVSAVQDLSDVPEGRNYMALDELWRTMDSRSSMLNTLTSTAILQSRKRRIDIDATAQFFGSVDLRFRGLVNLVLMPHVCMWWVDKYGDEYPIMLEVEESRPISLDQVGMPFRKFTVPLLVGDTYIPNIYDTTQIVERLDSGKAEYLDEIVDRYRSVPLKKSGDLKAHIEGMEIRAGRHIRSQDATLAAKTILNERLLSLGGACP